MFAKIWHFFFPVKPYIIKFDDASLQYQVLNSKTLEVDSSFNNKAAAKNYASMLNAFTKHGIDPHEGLFDRNEDKEFPELPED